MAQNDSDSINAWLLDLPPTVLQRRLATGVIIATVVGFVAVAPMAGRPVVELNAFFPSLDALVFITDLITAVLLFAQFSISGARALLALATGYFFTALIVIPHALTFAGAFSPTGLLGAGIQTGSWLFIFWHLGFSIGVLVYAVLRRKAATQPMRASAAAVITCTVVASLILVSVLTWLATAGQTLLPPIILDDRRISPHVIYPILFTIAICASALALLFKPRRSALDHWLAVVALVAIGELAFSGLLPSVRFSAGFYAGRALSLMTSSIVLIVLLAEMTHLYARVVRSNAALQRERDNKLMNMEAVTASIAHEVSQPLVAISTSGAAALNWLNRRPADLEEVQAALCSIIEASDRAKTIFDNIRALFGKAELVVHPLNLNDLVFQVIRTMDTEFKRHEVQIETQMTWRLPPILGHSGQLQEVVGNLLHNAIEAMDSVDRPRVVKVTTGRKDDGFVTVTVEDSGRGLRPEQAEYIFEPFVTTKTQGMGLGLAICRMIIQRHEGQLSAEPGKSRGAVFRITLPPTALPDS